MRDDPLQPHDRVKQVVTTDASGKKNGGLMELYKDGNKTLVYLTKIRVDAFKGYHLHRERVARYVCIRGEVDIILWNYTGDKRWQMSTYGLKVGDSLYIPAHVATGLSNTGDEEAWIVNYPSPAYDPEAKDEQVEYTLAELEGGVYK